MNVISIVGARPQFVKAAPVNRAFKNAGFSEKVIHTGQHFDAEMSDIFFKELQIPAPDYDLGINTLSHGTMTGRMLEGIEKVLLKNKPDFVVVYGDTNSTLAGALAACKLNIPLAHIEAGLRSFNKTMPEEHNRVLTDHCSSVLFCPTQTAGTNLKNEGFTNIVNNGKLIGTSDFAQSGNYPYHPVSDDLPVVINVGDTMYDAVMQFFKIAQQKSTIFEDLHLQPKEYMLATVHRPSNTDNVENLRSIFSAFLEIDETVICPVHPRTLRCLSKIDIKLDGSKLHCISPVGYLDMLMLEKHAKTILTDSGGMQKEAYMFGVPCITLRSETEWVETVEAGWNILVSADRAKIIETAKTVRMSEPFSKLYGDGKSSEKIAQALMYYGASNLRPNT